MKENPLKKIELFGQSIWLDYIRRDLITSGALGYLIEDDGLRGMTPNPAIFEQAIAGLEDRADQMKPLNHIINHESGLLGISETSSDMREILVQETKDIRAAEAVALFCYQAKKWIGAFAAALGGLNTLVFAGGIGENSPLIRSRICEGLEFLGIEIDKKQNKTNGPVISTDSSRVLVHVMHTNEERMIAKSVRKMINTT